MMNARAGTRFIHRVLRGAWFALGVLVCMLLLRSAGAKFSEPSSPMPYVTGAPAAPRVFVHGTLQRVEGSALPALCTVEVAADADAVSPDQTMKAALATVDVESSSSPIARAMTLSSDFQTRGRFFMGDRVDGERAKAWERHAKATGSMAFHRGPRGVVRERCFDAGERVFIDACVSPSDPGLLEPCPGQDTYLVFPGGLRPFVAHHANAVAFRIGAAALALLVGLLPLLRTPAPFIDELAARAPTARRRRPGARWTRFVVMIGCVVGLVHVAGGAPPSPIARFQLGFVWAGLVLVLWLFAALERRASASDVLSALAPVLDTPRSLLAHATGAVELTVRARMSGWTESLIGAEPVAFSEARITQVSLAGVHVSTLRRGGEELEIIDESGEGAVHLADALLDVEVRRVRMHALPARYAAQGVFVQEVPTLYYTVEERVIRDGAALYVYGDVGRVALRSGGAGYRSVRGAPTLGGAGARPVLVYAGDERGLVGRIVAHARQARSVGNMALFAIAAFGAALGYLASL